MFDLYTVLSLVPSFVRTQDKQIFLLVAAPKTYKQNPISRLKEVNLKIHIVFLQGNNKLFMYITYAHVQLLL